MLVRSTTTRSAARRVRSRDERGLAYPSPLVMLSIVAVAMAGIAFVVTKDQPETERRIAITSAPQATASETVEATPQPEKPKKPKKPQVQRAKVYVEVYNNTGIQGLAGRVSERANDIGWQVVGSDNWVGTIPATTVYFPPRLQDAGRQLALDLGIQRVQPAVGEMKRDRLTIVLTGELPG